MAPPERHPAPARVAALAVGARPAGTFPYVIELEGGKWMMEAPEPGAAEGSTADRIVAAIKGLRATAVVEEKADEAKLKEYGLAFPKVQVTLTVAPAGAKDTFQRKLLLGQPSRSSDKAGAAAVKTYAKRDDSPAIFEVDGQILKDLSKELFDLKDKTVVWLDREAVRRVDFGFSEPGKQTISIARHKDAPPDGGIAEETFEVLAPAKGPAKKWKVSSNLYALAGLKAAAPGEPAQAPGDKARPEHHPHAGVQRQAQQGRDRQGQAHDRGQASRFQHR